MSSIEERKRPDLSALRIHRDEEPESRFNPLAILKWLVVAAVLSTVVYFVYQRFIAPRSYPEVSMMTVKASVNQKSQASLTATGYLVAEKQATVTAKVGGRVSSLHFDVGSQVRAGQLLANLESTELEPQVAEAQASYTEATREYNRQRAMFREGIVSRALLDSAESQRTLAAARLQRVKVGLRDAVIRAPFSGTIIAKNAELGEMVSPISMSSAPGGGATGSIATLADLNTLEVEADVNESNLSQLRVGQPAEITVDAFPGKKWRGRLRQIVPTANRAKGVVQVKVRIDEKAAGLLPEMSASVSFLQSERTSDELNEQPKLWITPSAIAMQNDRPHVVRINAAKRVELVAVTLGESREGRMLVTGGLRDGEKIVAADAGKLKPGQRVRIAGEEE